MRLVEFPGGEGVGLWVDVDEVEAVAPYAGHTQLLVAGGLYYPRMPVAEVWARVQQSMTRTWRLVMLEMEHGGSAYIDAARFRGTFRVPGGPAQPDFTVVRVGGGEVWVATLPDEVVRRVRAAMAT